MAAAAPDLRGRGPGAAQARAGEAVVRAHASVHANTVGAHELGHAQHGWTEAWVRWGFSVSALPSWRILGTLEVTGEKATFQHAQRLHVITSADPPGIPEKQTRRGSVF